MLAHASPYQVLVLDVFVAAIAVNVGSQNGSNEFRDLSPFLVNSLSPSLISSYLLTSSAD